MAFNPLLNSFVNSLNSSDRRSRKVGTFFFESSCPYLPNNIDTENEDLLCNRLSIATLLLQSRKRETLEAVDGVKFCPLGHTTVSDASIQDSGLLSCSFVL